MKLRILIADVDTALKIGRICNDCRFEVDIMYGSTWIDGKSVLGLQQMIGKVVEVNPVTDNNNERVWLFKRLKEIGGVQYEESR